MRRFVRHRRSELVQSRFGGIIVVSKMTVVEFQEESVVKYDRDHPTHRHRTGISEKLATKPG